MSQLSDHQPSHPQHPTQTALQPSASFSFPREYHYPPFFTRQPILQTLHAQLTKWSQLVLAYCRAQRLFKLALADALDSALFHNRALHRRLDLALARELLDFMAAQGRAEWRADAAAVDLRRPLRDEAKNVVWVYWRTPPEWAADIADWVEETGQKNTVLTLYELTESEATIGREFHGMDPELLQKALSVLVKQGKAQIFGQDDGQGIKFF